MSGIIRREIIAPLATRVGSVLAGLLLAWFPTGGSTADELAAAFAIILLLIVDLIGSAMRRQSERNRESK